jgi:hypothetical protein
VYSTLLKRQGFFGNQEEDLIGGRVSLNEVIYDITLLGSTALNIADRA